MPPRQTTFRNQDPSDPGAGEPSGETAPVPTKKKNGNGWSKVKWALGGITLGILGAIGYDLYQKGKRAVSSDEEPKKNPALPQVASGFGPGTHTTVIGMPMPTAYPVPQQPYSNPARWNARDDDEDDDEFEARARREAARNKKRKKEKFEALVKEFEDES